VDKTLRAWAAITGENLLLSLNVKICMRSSAQTEADIEVSSG